MPLRLNIRVEGITQLQRKLRKEVLLAPPLREAMQATVVEAAQLVEARAPRGPGAHGGTMAASVTHRLDARPVPTWGRIAVTARRRSRKFPRGFAYPRLLEYGPKSRRRGWFRGALIPAQGVLARHIERAKRHIEAIWSR